MHKDLMRYLVIPVISMMLYVLSIVCLVELGSWAYFRTYFTTPLIPFELCLPSIFSAGAYALYREWLFVFFNAQKMPTSEMLVDILAFSTFQTLIISIFLILYREPFRIIAEAGVVTIASSLVLGPMYGMCLDTLCQTARVTPGS